MEVIDMYARSRPTFAIVSFANICFAACVPCANAEDGQSPVVSESRPSITIQDQSRRLLSPGFRLKQVSASASGKNMAELHLEDDRVYGEQNLFRTNQPPLLLKTAAYGLSQAVKLADHKLVDHRQPLLIDAMTSREASSNSPNDRAAACKYCGRGQFISQAVAATPAGDESSADSDGETTSQPTGTESKTVQELVDLMESLGPGVLEGSVFGAGELAEDRLDERQALIQNLEVFAARNRNPSACRFCSGHVTDEHMSEEASSPNPWFDADPETLPTVGEGAESSKSVMIRIEALRSSAEQLDEAANRLERRDLYYQSDQLREVAAELRADARNARVALMAQPGMETEVPELDRPESSEDFRPVTHSRIQFLEEQLEQLRRAVQIDRGSRLH